MQKLSHLHLLAIFLVTIGFTFGLLLVISQPLTPAALPPTPVTSDYNPAYYSVPTPAPLESQCALTGEAYELRIGSWQTAPSTVPYATYTSPDGHYVLYKEGDYLYVRDQQGQSVQLGSDVPFTDIVGRVFWSPNSRNIIVSPGLNNVPMLYDITATQTSAEPLNGLPSLDFRGWSPDGEHYLYGNGDGVTMSVGSVKTGLGFSTQPDTGKYSWSPDGHWLAYIWADGSNPASGSVFGLTLAAADTSVFYSHPFFSSGASTVSYLPTEMIWSPDSRYLALSYVVQSDLIYQHITIFSTDGKMLPDVTGPTSVTGIGDPLTIDAAPPIPPAHWSHQDHQLIYVRQLSASQYQLAIYSPDEGKNTTLVANLLKPWFESPSGQHLALYSRTNGLETIRITGPNSDHPVTMLENATDAGDPNWSPDDKWVALVWAQGKGSARQVHLSWMHPDGSERHDVVADFKDVRELRWMNGGAQLAYIAWRGSEGNSIEMVDTQTGDRTTLAGSFESVTNPDYNADTDTLSFWWKKDDSTFGKDAYQSDGTQEYHVLAAGEFDRPHVEFWSPDGKVLALKMPSYLGQADQMLVLDYPDGREPVIVRANLDGLGDPLWSPDSRMVAFTQWVRGDPFVPNPVGLAAISADGKTLWYDENFSLGAIDWFPCDT